ncbi:MAG: helix-turn-helix domain-containing protein [Culicoidibacterales bacterium]
MMNKIGPLLQELRISRGMTQKQVCRSLGYNINLSKIENVNKKIDFILIIDLLSLYNVKLNDFLCLADIEIEHHGNSLMRFINKNSTTVTKEQLFKKIEVLKRELESQSSPNLSSLLNFHRASCFYHLNFTDLFLQATLHFSYIWDHFSRSQDYLTLEDIKLAPLFIPFLNNESIDFLIQTVTNTLKRNNQLEGSFLLIRLYLNTSKKVFLQKDFHLLSEYCSRIDALLTNNFPADYIAEFFIIKGIMLIETHNDIKRGQDSIIRGQAHAKISDAHNITKNWKEHCDYYLNLKSVNECR